MTTQGECSRCSGKGTISAFRHVQGGVCFKCGGKGVAIIKVATANPYTMAKETEAYRKGVECVNAQPGSPFKPGSQQEQDFYRGQSDARAYAAKVESYLLTESFEEPA